MGKAKSIFERLAARYRMLRARSTDPESIEWAYRLFLDREPESQRLVIEKAQRLRNSREIRQEFINSEEFQKNNPLFYSPALLGNEPPMAIEEVHSEIDLQILFRHVQGAWQYLGRAEPYWSVLTADQFKLSNIEKNREAFYESGKADCDRLFKTLDRNGIDRGPLQSCLEYGCGLGRVTRWLSEKFAHVYGYDISSEHLQGAQRYLSQAGVRNVTLCHIEKIDELWNLPRVDVIYSVIVLQHNPPPVISFIIRNFIRALDSGGIAYFQIPTYQLGYKFSLDTYLKNEATKLEMETHFLPQHQVFKIAKEEHGKIIEVMEDSYCEPRGGRVSNTFVIQKE